MLIIEKITFEGGKTSNIKNYILSNSCSPEDDELDHPDDCNPGCHPDGVCSPDDDYNCSPDGDGLDCDPDGCLGDR